MAEIAQHRLEVSSKDLELLVEFGLLSEDGAREIIKKREHFELVLRRRTETKLAYLEFIKFELNLLESIEKYRKTILSRHKKPQKDKEEELDRKILVLQAHKLNDLIRSQARHISRLFRKLTIKYQFDKNVWLAYIDVAKSRGWTRRVPSLYWRLLRVASNDPDIWIAAASYEETVNKAFDSARGLYLRALRHHPKSPEILSEYFKMEVKYMEVIDRRARILFKIAERQKKEEAGDIWVDNDDDTKNKAKPADNNDELSEDEGEVLPTVKPIEEDDAITSGHLPKVIYDNATKNLDTENEFSLFLVHVLVSVFNNPLESKGLLALRKYIVDDIRRRFKDDNDKRITEELAEKCDDVNYLNKCVKLQAAASDESHVRSRTHKKLKQRTRPSRLELLYERYESGGIEKTRKLFNELDKSVKDQTLSLYVGMIQVETWHLAKNKCKPQLDKIRSIYDKAITKFGKVKPKLWYEYLQFEREHAKCLEDFERMNQLYMRAQSTLDPSKVDKLVEKYTLLQVKSSNADIEFSDYSDLED